MSRTGKGKHSYAIRLFTEEGFLRSVGCFGRGTADEAVREAILQERVVWARIYNETLSKRVDRWRVSHPTEAMGLVRDNSQEVLEEMRSNP